jgi:hypothetical protein
MFPTMEDQPTWRLIPPQVNGGKSSNPKVEELSTANQVKLLRLLETPMVRMCLSSTKQEKPTTRSSQSDMLTIPKLTEDTQKVS